jgi:hypothetical protein
VVKIQIQLTEKQARALEVISAQQGCSVAELIRQSVDNVIQSQGVVDAEEKRRRAVAAAGRFRSGQADLAVKHDHYLAEVYRQSAEQAFIDGALPREQAVAALGLERVEEIEYAKQALAQDIARRLDS